MEVDYKCKISASILCLLGQKKQRDICVNIIMIQHFAVLVMSDVQESILGY